MPCCFSRREYLASVLSLVDLVAKEALVGLAASWTLVALLALLTLVAVSET